MDFSTIQKRSLELYRPILALERLFPHVWRKRLKELLGLFTFLGLAASALLYVTEHFLHSTQYASWEPIAHAKTAFLLCAWIILFAFDAFYYSYIYKRAEDTRGLFIDFHLAQALAAIDDTDVTGSFLRSRLGVTFMIRLGILPADTASFLASQRQKITSSGWTLDVSSNQLSIQLFVEQLCARDTALADFLFAHGLQKEDVSGAADWMTRSFEQEAYAEAWWSEERLNRIPSIGQGWSYGRTPTLERYERGLPRDSFGRLGLSYGKNEIEEIISILSRDREANVLLVGDDEAGKLQMMAHLERLLIEGTVPRGLRHRRLMFLDYAALVSEHGSKVEFENEIILLMKEAVSAGNIILIIDDIASFSASTASFGSNLEALLEPYISSPSLQVVALSSTEAFHQRLENHPLFVQHFERVLVAEVGQSATIRVLEDEVGGLETAGIVFSYPALVAITESAERYFPDGLMPDKAVDLLLELTPKLRSAHAKDKLYVVGKSDVLALVETKTGVPVGEVRSEEREKLLALEDILHKRIVGQNEAITAVANAVRRARSGVGNPNRPMASFLFLGPTGVGKTETAKALSEVFFGANAPMMRIDMSEYSSADALSKLIGSFEAHRSGVLASMLREHQYGLLLLDEFEKTTREVMNLFLQILDEGFFSDMSGKKVNARNLIIIATSNAGSDMIWEAAQAGKNVAEQKDGIVDAVIRNHTFTPELLNRFDGVIVFHPLQSDHLKQVAERMLQGLHQRLSRKGINLVVDQPLVDFVARRGTDPKFGARPMNRAIEDEVEQLVAKKLIKGDIKAGSTVTLTAAELGGI